MPEYTRDPLPCFALLSAQGPAQIRDEQQGMWDPTLAECARLDLPASFSAPEIRLRIPQIGFVEIFVQGQLLCRLPNDFFRRPADQLFTSAIDQPQSSGEIKDKDCD